jgi:HD superfamily phosphohydrolase
MAAGPADVSFLRGYPRLAGIVVQLNEFLIQNHPQTFGNGEIHPILPAKRSKVIHDNLWGTVRFTWRELALIDSPIMQRLRDIHQTGLAFHVYPSARHTRFEHSLGAATIASRIFDALLHRQRNEIRDIVKAVWGTEASDTSILRLKQELRLAALLHDVGHSLYSHTSELVYSRLTLLMEASKELSLFLGKEKGAGEVLSFCLALTPAVAQLLTRTEKKGLIGDHASDDYDGQISLENVALIIVGRSIHPFLQFLGDVVSSAFDADKLDYLLRDAQNAGLPLRYDLDRYLYDIRIANEVLPDDNGELQKLYTQVGARQVERRPGSAQTRYPYYETYRLRLSRRAMNVIEQIIICKMMLFSYIYHHAKVRASDGLLERLLRRRLQAWRARGDPDERNLDRFLKMTDATLQIGDSDEIDEITKDYQYRLINRLLPREVYSISGPSATHAQGELIQDFLIDLHDRDRRELIITELEDAIGSELLKLDPALGTTNEEAAARAGVWVDAPKPPKFEDVDEMVMGSRSAAGVPLAQLFPIREWTQAYEHYRYQVRIFAFSEYYDIAAAAAKAAMQRVLRISSDLFYENIRRTRR